MCLTRTLHYVLVCILKDRHVRGQELVEACGAEGVAEGVCCRWPLKVHTKLTGWKDGHLLE